MTGRQAAFLAVDLGAESGRVLLGEFDGGRVSVRDVIRFGNRPVALPDGLHWDALGMFRSLEAGLAQAKRMCATELSGIAVDSWAVDFGLLDAGGSLISNPYCYRDPRTADMIDRAVERMPKDEIYRLTGIQFLQINTLYQLLALEGSPQMDIARTLLMIPDLMNYWLTGQIGAEFTNVTTTQLYDAGAGEWSMDLLVAMGIPRALFPDVTSPGTVFAPLLSSVAKEAGVPSTVPVISTGSHDTASAVVAVPARTMNFAYISSGTWSLVGLELPKRIVTDAAMEANFTNEGGFAGTNRFLKNVMGLWLLQECRSTWKHTLNADYSYEELVRLSKTATSLRSVVDPDIPDFLPPGDMPARIGAFCRHTGQAAPETPGEFARCILESLALKYRLVIDEAELLSGRTVDVIHIVGGGSQNEFLCQATADATGRLVVAGPVEATAMGNTLGQAHALGYVGHLTEMREVIRNSVLTKNYEPSGIRDEWDEAARRLDGIKSSGWSALPGGSKNRAATGETVTKDRAVTKQRVAHG